MKSLNFLFLFLIGGILSSCGDSIRITIPPKAEKGVLDLRHWHFSDENINLDGEWEFYWKEFKDLQSFSHAKSLKQDNREAQEKNEEKISYIKVPLASWASFEKNGVPVGKNGYATYHLKVYLPKDVQNRLLSLRVRNFATAYQLFINGKKIIEAGTVGTSTTQSKPRYLDDVRSFIPHKSELDIVLYASNFSYAKGGFWEPFTFGSEKNVYREKFISLGYDLFLLGVLFMMFVYHMRFFYLNNKKTAYFFFSFFALFFSIRVLTRGNMFITTLFPLINFNLQIKLEYLAFYLSIPIFYWFLSYTFPGFFRIRFAKVVTAIALTFSLVVVFTPTSVFTHTVLYYELFAVFVFFSMLFGIFRAIRAKQSGAIVTFIGAFIFAVTGVNDILYTNRISPIPEISPLGLFIFIFTQTFTLSLQFSKSFKKVELLSNYLTKLNKANTRFVPQDVLKFLEKENVIDVQLGDNVSKQMAVLFTDIRNFTSISEKMTPQENFVFLNSYLRHISPIVRKNNGFIDKYLGDGIMALFPEGADHALQAGIEIQRQIRSYNAIEKSENIPFISAGVGIHVGLLMLGTIGETERLTATAVSKSVDIASHFESLTKQYGISIVVSEEVKNTIKKNYQFRRIGTATVITETIKIYEVLDFLEPQELEIKLSTLSLFEQAVENFEQKNYLQAKTFFTRLVQRNPNDKVAHYYIDHIEKEFSI